MSARVTRQNPLLTGRDLDTYGVYTVNRDGVTDDRANLAAADAAATAAGKVLVLHPGVHLVSSALAISSHVIRLPGAILKPASGATVSLNGGMSASLSQVFDLSAGGKARVRNPVVYPEWWGAVGDGTTDDAVALRMVFNDNIVAYGGGTIEIPFGKVYASSLPIDMKNNTRVVGSGTLKCLAFHGAGMFIQYKNAVKNVVWDGPTVDINYIENMNAHAIGDVPNTTDFVDGIWIWGKVLRTRIDKALEAFNTYLGDVPVLYGGGGKGLTVQFRARNVYAHIIAEDCDIACSVEAAVSDDRWLENVVLDVQSKDSHRTALFIGGSRDGISSINSGSYMHSKFPGVKVRLRAQGGQDGLMYSPTSGLVDGDNWSNAGVVTLNYASGVDIEVYAATVNRCTLVRGMAAASTIRITNALMDELQDVWDTRPLDTLTPAGSVMSDNVFEANIHAATHHGVLVRPHRSTGTPAMQRATLDVDVWCQNGVGAITQDDAGVTDSFGASVAYRFRDIRSSPIKEVVGLSGHNAKPQWSLVASGGRVASQRESWHDGTREVAIFDTTGWQFLRAYFNESPLVFGNGGNKRKWLHYDSAAQMMRIAGSAPAAETSGLVLATQGGVNLADGATTAAVTGGVSLLVTANTAPTSLSTLTGGYTGQVVTIRFGDANTTVVHSSFRLRGGASRTFPLNATLTLVSSGGGWYEIGSSDTVPLSSVVDSTTEALGVGTLEVGHATDTTLARLAAGRVAVEGAEVITATAVAALAAKASPVDADVLALFDSAASGAAKKLTLADLKTVMLALIVASAPATLDTLDELAAALGDDANFAATMTSALALKAPLASPTFTGTVKGVPYDITYVQTVTTRAVGLGSNIIGVRMMRACQVTSVAYRCVDADSSGDLVVELRKNGVQIAASVATIAAANQTSATVVTGVNTSFAAGDILTVYVTAVGTTPGAGLYADIAAVTV